jgi:hypothetical protein
LYYSIDENHSKASQTCRHEEKMKQFCYPQLRKEEKKVGKKRDVFEMKAT